jgi:hypothetical protein
LSDRVDRAARGTDIPAGIERGEIGPPNSSRERGRLRRRLRELRRLREALLLELGALVMEAHRHGREDDSPVIQRKAADAAGVDAEARAIAEALGTEGGLDTIVAAGIAGPCPTCGTLTSTAARFCSTCGTALDGRPAAPAEIAAEEPPESHPSETPPSSNGDGASPAETEQLETTGSER